MHAEYLRCTWVLPALLLAGAPSPAGAEEPTPTWVFFADRGREGAELSAAIEQRATELSPRALERRRRARGDFGVDARDLPPAPAYVASVLGTGARLRSRSRWLNAVSVDADSAQLAAIARLPGVERLELVARRRRLAPAPDGSGLVAAPHPRGGDETFGLAHEQLERLGIPRLRKCGLSGAGVVVGVQDSGFSLEHAALRGVEVVAAHDFLQGDDVVASQPGEPSGQHDHGTMVLSLLAGDDPGRFMGAAPGISVILAKTEDVTAQAPVAEDRFVEGIEWVESMGADLFTSSLGDFDGYTPEQLDGHTAVSSKAATVAVEQGLMVFVSTGRSGPDATTRLAPGDAEGVITVGTFDEGGRIEPDVLAPGRAIWAADPSSRDDYGQGDGTSLAAPLAVGAAALLLEAFPELDPAAMRAMLQQPSSRTDAARPVTASCTCTDDDLDGAFGHACGGDDCNDADPGVHPGAAEVCGDGRDDDCNGLTDDADPSCDDGLSELGSNEPSSDDGGTDASPGEPSGDLAEDEASAPQGCGFVSMRESGPLLFLLWWLGRRRTPRGGYCRR